MLIKNVHPCRGGAFNGAVVGLPLPLPLCTSSAHLSSSPFLSLLLSPTLFIILSSQHSFLLLSLLLSLIFSFPVLSPLFSSVLSFAFFPLLSPPLSSSLLFSSLSLSLSLS